MPSKTIAQNTVTPIKTNRVIWYGFLSVLVLIGVYGLIMRMEMGLISTNLTSNVPWGAWVAFYIYFVGLSAGAFLLSSLIFVFGMEKYEKIGREALLAAILSMVLAMMFISLDLGRMERFWHSLVYFNPFSVLAYEVRFYGLYVLILIAELYLSMRQDLIKNARKNDLKGKIAKICSLGSTDLSKESEARDHKWLKILGSIGIPIAIFGVHGGTGALFAVVKAQHYWNSAVFPVIFVVSALVSGTALLITFYIIRQKVKGGRVDKAMVQSLAGLMIGFLIVDIGLQFYEYLISAYSLDHQALDTLAILFGGKFSFIAFWLVQTFIGAVVPIFLYLKFKESVNALLTAAIMVVLGIVAVRFNIVVPPLLIPQLAGLSGGYYFPSSVEWMTSVGVIGFGLLLYSLAVSILPVDLSRPIEKMGERSER
ncbi:MAG: molybdopterin oxidoreductase [Clostridiaceae bacterium BRH_c20a]|nr:MAG: molybdopterin oxidoreductase [Clostridiaceae bacterium BRH_c20a]